MADSKTRALPVLFGETTTHRPDFNRPTRASKRWVVVEKFRWVVAPQGEHAPYLVSYFVEELHEVHLPADRPQIDWDL